MDELIEVANKCLKECDNQQDTAKFALIAEIVSRPNWVTEVKTEYALKILEDLNYKPANNKYVELMVEALNDKI